jgi:hypothetical protein
LRNTGLAAAIEADLLRQDRQRADITSCFQCGHGMMYRGSRFCSDRCRDFYDAGNAGFAQDWRHLKANYGIIGWRVVAGPPGIVVGSDYYKSLRGAFGKRAYQGPMRPTKAGFLILCANCQKEFESKGLRCCSDECERRYREKEDNLAVMAKIGIKPAVKRRCEGCGAVIPKWSKGRRVSSAKRFCSNSCAQKARRAA